MYGMMLRYKLMMISMTNFEVPSSRLLADRSYQHIVFSAARESLPRHSKLV